VVGGERDDAIRDGERVTVEDGDVVASEMAESACVRAGQAVEIGDVVVPPPPGSPPAE
jgi:hypothetical protein